MNDETNAATNNTYRQIQPTTFCASCQSEGKREAAAGSCSACATPLCEAHLPKETCEVCLSKLARRQEAWGFGSWQLHLVLWSSTALVLALLFGVAVSGGQAFYESLPEITGGVALVILVVVLVLPFVALGLTRYLQRRPGHFRADRTLFAKEQRAELERRRALYREQQR